jgi:hypothetical protein
MRCEMGDNYLPRLNDLQKDELFQQLITSHHLLSKLLEKSQNSLSLAE